MEDQQKLVNLIVQVPAVMKKDLERIAFDRSKPGLPKVTLRTVVHEALEEYLLHQYEVSQGQHRESGNSPVLDP